MNDPEEKARTKAGAKACEASPDDSAPLGGAQALALLMCLHDAGVKFVAQGGGLWMSPRDVLDYVRDPESVIARDEGVTVDELHAFRAANGQHRCHALTKKGMRYRDWVGSGFSMDAATWAEVEARGGCCWRHGGAKARDGGRHEA